MSDKPTRRLVLKGMAATGLALPLGLLISGKLDDFEKPVAAITAGQGNQPKQYVFASDPRAKLDEYQVMPG